MARRTKVNIPPGTHREKERDDDDERYTEWVAEGAPKMSPSSGKRFLDLRAQQNRKREEAWVRGQRDKLPLISMQNILRLEMISAPTSS